MARYRNDELYPRDLSTGRVLAPGETGEVERNDRDDELFTKLPDELAVKLPPAPAKPPSTVNPPDQPPASSS